VSDINTALVDRLKALDPNRPIREADIRNCDLAILRLAGVAGTGVTFARGVSAEFKVREDEHDRLGH
jgi:hypothetical protein